MFPLLIRKLFIYLKQVINVYNRVRGDHIPGIALFFSVVFFYRFKTSVKLRLRA